MKTDFLIIGSGIAGLNYAIRVADYSPGKIVTIVSKQNLEESNTKYAQGGIAVVQDIADSFESHIADTLKAGDGCCDREIVELVVRNAPKCLHELAGLGIRFDENRPGHYDLGLEGGHSNKRIVHAKDQTGLAIERGLLETVRKLPNIRILENHFAIDLILDASSEKPTCVGVQVLDTIKNELIPVYSKITMIASGGIGQVYKFTTNPLVATGDGIAMASRAGARIRDMEYIQFHPTSLYIPNVFPSFLISEAVRGFGAVLRNGQKEEFMQAYDARRELAPRDIVSRAMINEMQQHPGKFLYLDCRHLDMNAFRRHFPTIHRTCREAGFDPGSELIPVVPAQHYVCGGINVNSWGETNIRYLYACGESARTGLHGANRLASNSLLEALVFSERSARRSMETIGNIPCFEGETGKEYVPEMPNDTTVIRMWADRLRELMWEYAGIIRSDNGLAEGMHAFDRIEAEMNSYYEEQEIFPSLCELRNLLIVGRLIFRHSLAQSENHGGLYNRDRV